MTGTKYRSARLIAALAWACLCGFSAVASRAEGPVSTAADGAEECVQWRLWEKALTASSAHDDPYRRIRLDIEFTGPGGRSLRAPGYWDGGGTFRIRAAFPAPGTWSWRTTCSDATDAGLHHVTGKVEVRPYAGDHPLYGRGMPEVSPDKRYLRHADGTPFLWLGDTAWNVAWSGTLSDWRDYVRKRAGQGFSVLQVHVTTVGAMRPRPAGMSMPFAADGTPGPEYWRELDEKVGLANEQGLVVLLVGLGQARSNEAERDGADLEFARYAAGRFNGRFAIYSPSMDRRFDELNDRFGDQLRGLTSHLIIQHPGTHFPTSQTYHDAAYADFCGLQSGHHRGDLEKAYEAARAWTLDLWNREPVKPVINIEAMYDGRGDDDGPNWREQDARKLGWITWLSGSRGYTYGAGDVAPKVPRGSGGVWWFNSDPAAYDYWRKCLDWPSAAQMTLMRDFFAGIEWWRLEPAPGLILNQASEETRKMAASRTAAGDLLVAYLPDNAGIELDLSGLKRPASGRWFNPVDESWKAAEVPDAARATFARPDGWEDAVLLLTSRSEKGSPKQPAESPREER